MMGFDGQSLTFILLLVVAGATVGILTYAVAVLSSALKATARNSIWAATVGIVGAIVSYSALMIFVDTSVWPWQRVTPWIIALSGVLAVFYWVGFTTLDRRGRIRLTLSIIFSSALLALLIGY